MANSYGSRAVSSGYSHSGLKAGAPRVNAGGPGNGKSGIGAVKGNNSGVSKSASGSTPKGMSTYKAGKGV